MTIQPTLKAIAAYHETLATYAHQGMHHELAVRQAFATLLETTAKPLVWTLIMEYSLPKRKRIDGCLLDDFRIPRGYWEAKDSSDNLETEIRKKIDLDYPLSNTIFEDTQTGVLYQNGQRVMESDLTSPTQVRDLLALFFNYTEPHIEAFHTAVTTFQDRIPALAAALVQHIDHEQHANPRFIAAFNRFMLLCKQALNPTISEAAMKELLVQHLLTERFFRTIFHNSDFTRRNTIAIEIETVIDALTSRSFSRNEFLQKLDHFYYAIEQAALTIRDYTEKQTFLNMVYERFFQGYSQKQADTYGIVYTPQEIVDFMCASVEEVLRQEFGESLSSEGVSILDPCVGTGNFIMNIIHRLDSQRLHHKYTQELFCNEVMLLPYYIATLNIEHAYYERSGEYEPFNGICFIDTLDINNAQDNMFGEVNTQRIKRECNTTIKVIIGNPPYNMGQVNENDNNQNRKYEELDKRVRDTYAKDSQASLKNKLYDPYVKFFRWATDRLKGEDGVICFVSNNSFIQQIAFDGMRKHLAQDFTRIYHLDLHGNVRRNPKLSGTTHNVFGIQVGVGITLLVRKAAHPDRQIWYYRVPEEWRREQKLAFLAETGGITGITWEAKQPNATHMWLTHGLRSEFATFLPMGTKAAKSKQTHYEQALFRLYSLGVVTSRDEWVYAFQETALSEKMRRFIQNYNYEVFRYTEREKDPEKLEDFINAKRDFLKWTDRLKTALLKGKTLRFDPTKLRLSLYRPFCKQVVYFDHLLNQRRYQQHRIFPTPETEQENFVICVSGIGSNKPFQCLVSSILPCLDTLEKTQCFPYYTYDEDGNNRRENIPDWALAQFRTRYGETVCKWDIFWYTYAILHHPTYLERYAENLRYDLPRIPLLGERKTFLALAAWGKHLAKLHMDYEQAAEYPLTWQVNQTVPWSWDVTQMQLSADKRTVVVNDALTLTDIPPACYEYQIGNRSALEWVIEQYRSADDTHMGYPNDPNRPDDPEYIVRLVQRIVYVSVETVATVAKIGTVSLDDVHDVHDVHLDAGETTTR